MSKFKNVVKRSGAIVPFTKIRIVNAIYRAAISVGGRDKERAEILADKVIDYLEKKFSDDHVPNIEEIQDAVEKILIENGHAKVAKEFILYRDERNKSRMSEAKIASKPDENIPWAKIWRVLDWASTHNLNTIEKYNTRINNNEFPHIVHESEAAYEDDLDTAADMILERSDKLRMVFISGPSSSGKTTTTIKIEERLKKNGLKFATVNVDNYFFDLEDHPKDEFGDYDFETPQALDLELINEHLLKLSNGEEVKIPFYDFRLGKRYMDKSPMKLRENEIILIDSLHGLFPAFSKEIPGEVKFKLYLEPLLQMKDKNNKYIQWTDIRLMRRMLRDSVHRAYDPLQTLEHWHYVRSSELRNIIPFANSADFIINSAMPYELSLYKTKLFEKFKVWKNKFKDNPLKEDAFLRAERICNFMEEIIEFSDESPIPKDSVLREFIGGSVYKY
ncbi:MAG: response regulator SirA [Ignavibacteriales bacterium]|nr:response regulator SirA [Ignavibacteriales bacterium]MBK7979481.1 response regulator SirA [Ignavibacteriota bacterium]